MEYKKILIALSLVASGTYALAEKSEDNIKGSIDIKNVSKASYASLAKITLEEAVKKAQARSSGKVMSSHLEKEDGYLVYAVNIINADKKVTEILVDAGNGEILGIEKEDGKND